MLRRVLGVAAAVLAVGAGAVVPAAGASEMGVEAVCGLDVYPLSGGGYGYTITNCNGVGVWRRIVKEDGSRGSCRYIAGYSAVNGSSVYHIIGYEAC